MYIDSHKYNSFPVVAICTTKFDCSLHEIDYFDSYHLESDSRYSKQLASNKGDNKEANSRQESDSNDNLGKKFFYAKRGQLNLSCANCHVDFAGRRIRG
jgi:hypothetical protein